jgi:hypothetical protein
MAAYFVQICCACVCVVHCAECVSFCTVYQTQMGVLRMSFISTHAKVKAVVVQTDEQTYT